MKPAALAVGVLGLLGFALWERRSAHPMVPLELFRDRNFSGTSFSIVLLSFTAGGLLLALRPGRGEKPATDVGWMVLGIAWVGGGGAAATSILMLPGGRLLLIAFVMVVALGDIGAYFVGRALGRLPRAAGAAYAALAACFVVGWLGDLLKLPDWLIDASPFDDLSTLTVLSKFYFEGLLLSVNPELVEWAPGSRPMAQLARGSVPPPSERAREYAVPAVTPVPPPAHGAHTSPTP